MTTSMVFTVQVLEMYFSFYLEEKIQETAGTQAGSARPILKKKLFC